MRDKPAESALAPKKAPRQSNILLRIIALLVTLALVIGAVALVAYRDRWNLDALKRRFTYRSLERSETGQAQSFSHEGTIRDDFCSADGGILVTSSAGIRLYSDSGNCYVDRPVSLSSPVSMTSGDWSLVYDVGGTELVVFRDRTDVFSLSLKSGQKFLSARINRSGYLAIITQESGYKGSVLVYDNKFQPMVQLNLSSSFLMDAAVAADNKTLAVVTIGQNSYSFESRLDFYLLEHLLPDQEPTPDASCSLGDNVILDLREQGGAFWALGENSLSAVSASGELLGSYSYNGRYLKEFSLDGEGYAVLLLGKYRSGSLADLVVVDREGVELASQSLNDQVLYLAAAGRYTAVLTADRLDIYTGALEPYSTLEDVQSARKILLRDDGTAVLIASDTAQLYIPN